MSYHLSRTLCSSQAPVKSADLTPAELFPPIFSQTKSKAFVDEWSRDRYDLKGVCVQHVCACSLPTGSYAGVLVQVCAVTELLNETWCARRKSGII